MDFRDSLKAATEVVSRQLDDFRDADIANNCLPSPTLQRLFSPDTKSAPSSTSAFAKAYQAVAVLEDVSVGFRAIGFGQCGLVFERPGRGYAVKLSKPGYADRLWADFTAHQRVHRALPY